MNILVIIISILLGIFAQAAAQAASNFRGSSKGVYTALCTAGNFGVLIFFIYIIWGFWKFPWWVPVTSVILPFLMMPLIIALSEKIWVRVLSVVAVPSLIIWLLLLYLK